MGPPFIIPRGYPEEKNKDDEEENEEGRMKRKKEKNCASTKVFVCPQAKPLYCCLLPILSHLHISIRNTVLTQPLFPPDVLIYHHHPQRPRQEYLGQRFICLWCREGKNQAPAEQASNQAILIIFYH